MNKSKFIAATITTLVLFAIVRVFSPAPPVEETSPLEVESLEPSEDPVQIEGKDLNRLSLAPEKPKAVKSSPSKDIKQSIKLEAEKLSGDATDMSAFFSVKSGYTYFKIKDGLALIGGDIVLGELTEEQQKDKSLAGKLLKDKPPASKLWPSSEIPFGFNEGFPQNLRPQVLQAIQYFNSETVVNFIPVDVDQDEDAIVFKLREGAPCSSYLGRIGGLQPIYLNSACSSQDVIHEFMHALGFVHEQQREGRDEHLEILWDNIEDGFGYNFSLLPDSLVHQYQGSVFDLSLKSVMMYHDEAFAKDGKKSMRSKRGLKISPSFNGLAEIDKERLELLYGG